jgi:hypothetical protein
MNEPFEPPGVGDGAPDDDAFREGVLLGILIGEGHFGGDGRQPQVTLRMHTRHAKLFQWIQENFPGGKLYGPYTHGGRNYLQWMARGAFLRQVMVPLLNRRLTAEIDMKSLGAYLGMLARYNLAGDAAPRALPAARSRADGSTTAASADVSPTAVTESASLQGPLGHTADSGPTPTGADPPDPHHV